MAESHVFYREPGWSSPMYTVHIIQVSESFKGWWGWGRGGGGGGGVGGRGLSMKILQKQRFNSS
jgi:hypothetical protein